MLHSHQYDPAGRIAVKRLDNGLFTTYQYDSAGQLLALTNALAPYVQPRGPLAIATVLSSFNYTYDSRGRRISMDTLDGGWSYEYDDLGQLTHAVLASTAADIPNQDLRYVYDEVGNRVWTVENGVTKQYTANSLNQYVTVGTTNYTFDADGNLIKEVSTQGTTTYVYNDENRLVSATSPQGAWQYTYDGLGNRVAKTENGTRTRYVVDPIGLGNVVGEYDGAGNLLAHYDHALGLLSRTDAGGKAAGYTFDAIGNVQEVVSAAGAFVNRYAYTPFGKTFCRVESIPNPLQFLGQFGVRADTTGQIFARNRYYNPQTGRFESIEPLGILGGNANYYTYAFNNPNTYCDADGRCVLLANPYFIGGVVGGGAYGVGKLVDWVITGKTDFNLLGFGGAIALGALSGGFSELALADALGVGFARFLQIGVAGIAGIEAKLFDAVGGSFTEWYEFVTAGLGGSLGPLMTEGIIEGKILNQWLKAYFDAAHGMIVESLGNGTVLVGTQLAGNGTTAVDRPRDPNQLTGPAGFGPNGFLPSVNTFAYRIDFENFTNATAPAQQVIITDSLSTNFDWTAFNISEVGFGDRLIALPLGVQHFETNLPVSYLGTNFQVQIQIGIQPGSGQVYANFRSIDPATSLPPPVNIGFLPPEDGTGRGQGHVTYTIRTRSSVVTGTQLRNVALISFDNQPVISTDQVDPNNAAAGIDVNKQCLITIDAGRPASHVLPLPAQSQQLQFPVSWSGQDDAGGSGVASFDLYFSDNGSPWTNWLSGTAATNATFQGKPQHTYGFYSTAHDHAGNVELPHATADAAITVVANPLLVLTVSPSITNLNPGDTFTYTVTVNNSGTLNLTGVLLSNPLPAGLTVEWVQYGRGSCDLEDAWLAWSLGTVNTNKAYSMTVTATVLGSATMTNFMVVNDNAGAASANTQQIIRVGTISPQLSIALTNQQVVISWPDAAAGFNLQSTTNFASQASWTLVTNVPVVVGGQRTVSLPPASASQFYRLKKP